MPENLIFNSHRRKSTHSGKAFPESEQQRDAYARMAMEAENPVLPSKGCPIATVESSRMSSKWGAGGQTDNEDVQEKLLSFTNFDV